MPVIDNPKPHVIPEGENATPLEVVGATASDKLVIIMVGLPGNGKTHVSRRISRYISFFHDIPSQIFNVGEYRRKMVGVKLPASYYDHSNLEALAERKKACDKALGDLIEYMAQDGVRLGIYDATNSTPEARAEVLKRLKDSNLGVKKMFIEVICDDDNALAENIHAVKSCTPDYKDVDPEEAVKDFMERRKNYMDIYKEVEDDEGSYVKVLNYRKFVIHNIRGYLPSKVVHFTMNLHTMPRTFYLTRHGQSEYNTVGKIGGDSGLSKNGLEYAKRLAKYANEVIGKKEVQREDGEKVTVPQPARLWTSTLLRTKETAQFIKHETLDGAEFDNGDKVSWVNFRPNARRNLDELYAGVCDGMTYKEIEEMYPDEFAARQNDKLKYRYPRGESYMDVTLRLEPLAHDLERTREPILIVGHQGIHRIIYAYFMGLSRKEAPFVRIPLNHVIILKPHAYGCDEERICLMPKHEMVCDGQDEPITSMPVKSLLTEDKKEDDGGTLTKSGSDPLLDAPSC
eukprot:CAMPEP_0203640042 /NCGR_PEP_ID=MMETSP0088-20131115/5633_1 /ASSEMBLY_ACC=CAM_ASM_001087 /TAXON_ID=426623 /ORGANISM="Chaetoceros affinis, Strain CCMP159" /LENGTH=513 /DNA_ID=CAMNT_0050495103 /DNA_START=156 /DNA_END=1697 /DNA_ORIENTATION=-